MMRDLADAKEGDAVAVHSSVGWGHTRLRKATVGRCTATIVYIDGHPYSRRNGARRPGYYREWAEPWTSEHDVLAEEMRIAEKLQNARAKLRDFKWHDVSLETADKVLSILAENK